MKIAFLGLGRMGRALAGHLVDGEYELVVWNRTRSAADELAQRGATVANTAAEAVHGAGTVITVLFGPETVREVVVDADLPIPAGALWIDITTISPSDGSAFARWSAEHGVRYVHSPVIGSIGPARAGQLGVLLGGDADAVEDARPIVSRWADPSRLRTYDTPAKAATAKLLANLGLAASGQGLVEALRLGRSQGLTTDDVLEALDHTLLAPIRDLKGEMIRTGSFSETQFSADALAKDTRLMLQSSDYPLPAVADAFESLEFARRTGHGDDDFSVIAAFDRA